MHDKRLVFGFVFVACTVLGVGSIVAQPKVPASAKKPPTIDVSKVPKLTLAASAQKPASMASKPPQALPSDELRSVARALSGNTKADVGSSTKFSPSSMSVPNVGVMAFLGPILVQSSGASMTRQSKVMIVLEEGVPAGLYLLDCSVGNTIGRMTVTDSAGNVSNVAIQAGHALFGFQRSAGRTGLTLAFPDDDDSGIFSCDLIPVK